jgi:cytochrome c-type biogenesis protein CcmH
MAAGTALAAIQPLPFRDAEEEARFRRLTAELRCMVCQNQSLADSDAPLAADLRREVLRLMQEGLADEDIKRFLVQRYSDFVLYRPPFRADTLALWLGPLIVLFAGLTVLVVVVRRNASRLRRDASQPLGEDW